MNLEYSVAMLQHNMHTEKLVTHTYTRRHQKDQLVQNISPDSDYRVHWKGCLGMGSHLELVYPISSAEGLGIQSPQP